jgi:hypothetical protein
MAGRDQLQGVADAARQLAVGAEPWFDKETGRPIGFQLNGQTLRAPVSRASLVVNLFEPTAANPFEPSATFMEVPLGNLLGDATDAIGGRAAALAFPARAVSL